MRRVGLGCVLVWGWTGAVLPLRAASDAEVAARIEQLRTALLAAQQPDGNWQANPGYPVGSTALVLLALKHGGVPNDHAAVQRALKILLDKSDNKVYSESLVICALEQIDPVAYKARIAKAAAFLAEAQETSGGWSYGSKGGVDNSNSQFAVLGLAAAARCGVKTPSSVIQNAIHYWEKGQNQDGGWGYRNDRQQSTMSMTCAGTASLFLLGEPYETPEPACGRYKTAKELENGLAWLGEALARVSQGHGGGLGQEAYTLYALERVGMLLQVPAIGNVDWYRFGADRFLQPRRGGGTVEQAFALLFLSKAANPVAVAKWKWDGDWNEDRHDVQHWVETAGLAFKRPLDWVAAPLDKLDSPAARASLIFVNGHNAFKTTPAELQFLRSFLHEGKGTLVLEACCNNPVFAESAKRELAEKLEPNRPGRFQRIAGTHPLYAAFHPLRAAELPISELKTSGCQKVRVFFLEQEISCALNGDMKQEVRKELAEKLAVNLTAYALQSKQPQGKLDPFSLTPETPPPADLTADQARPQAAGQDARRLAEPFGRLKHRGDWQADPTFFRVLQKALAADPRFPAFDRELPVDPAGGDLFQVSALFMTGHDDPDLTDKEMLNLRTFLQNGGALVASCCCSKPEFDQGFRRLMTRVFPNDKLEAVPPNDPVFLRPLVLAGRPAAGTKAYEKAYGTKWAPLLGIRRDGRWAVLYTPVDACCGLEGDLDQDVLGYAQEAALPLLINGFADAMGVDTQLRRKDP